MKRHTLETIAASLDHAHVRFLVAGGMAVVAHGFLRFTADLDIILDPDREALTRAVETLSSLGYGPRAPVALTEFADASKRAAWARDKQMTVFSLFSSRFPDTEIDLFLESPFEFESAYTRATRAELPEGPTLAFVSLQDLIQMKRLAGRPRDLEDIAKLEALHSDDGSRHE